MIVQSYLNHTVPASCALVLMLSTNCVLMRRHAKGLFAFAGFYCLTNWYGVVYGGSPVTYFFLPWNDY